MCGVHFHYPSLDLGRYALGCHVGMQGLLFMQPLKTNSAFPDY